MNKLDLALTVLALATGTAAAQDLTFYESPGFGGQGIVLNGVVNDLGNSGFNDRAASVWIRSGNWQVCTDANFRGRCITLQPGEYRDLSAMGFSNNISSARPLGSGTPAVAVGPGPAGPPVILFEDFQLSGVQFPVPAGIDNLDRSGFNDRARSMIISAGRWELCRDAGYTGGCQVYGPGRYDGLGELSGQVSSLRPVDRAGAAPTGLLPDWGDRVRAILYSNPNFEGQQYVINADVLRDLRNTGFNDRAQSIRVERGYWIFCRDADFGGTCRTFGPGEYPNLPWGLDNAVSSGRRISQDFPYNANPNWGR